jgi:hypothetical protein
LKKIGFRVVGASLDDVQSISVLGRDVGSIDYCCNPKARDAWCLSHISQTVDKVEHAQRNLAIAEVLKTVGRVPRGAPLVI